MIEFKPVEIGDMQWIKESVKYKSNCPCEYSFGNIFTYSAKYDIYVTLYKGFFISYIKTYNSDVYSYPVGKGYIKSVLDDLIELIKQNGRPTIIYGMNTNEATEFNNFYKDLYTATVDKDSFDYCYNYDDLAYLKGKKYQPKRNHYSYFIKNNDWKYEKINSDNIHECLEMSKIWLDNYQGDKQDLIDEYSIINKIFDNYDELGYKGALLRANGKVVAYTMGEALDEDHFCVHIEKAFSEVRGSYQSINKMFVENELKGYKYINREDDVGLENLRKAKMSYHPAYFEIKYEARIL